MELMQSYLTQDQKTEWVGALRSGYYKQGFDFLRQDNYFCPLGVLMDVINPTGWILMEVKGEKCFYDNIEDVPNILPTESIFNPKIKIVYMNDKEYKSFFEIAEWIEKNVVGSE